MDESAIEKAGAKPLDHDLKSIAALKSKGDLAKEAMRLHREGTDVLFSFGSGSDFKNASQIIAEVDQEDLACPTAITTSRTMPSRSNSGRSMYSTSRKCSSY